MVFPQYAKSEDPAVIEAILANGESFQEFKRQADGFARKYGSTTGVFYVGGIGHTTTLNGIQTPARPTPGQWTRTRSGGWRPFKNNPAYVEMAAIRHKATPIPGLPETVDSVRDVDWRHYMMTPQPFICGDAAWLGFSHMPDQKDERNEIGPQWTEVLTSQYYAAREARSALADAAAAESGGPPE